MKKPKLIRNTDGRRKGYVEHATPIADLVPASTRAKLERLAGGKQL